MLPKANQGSSELASWTVDENGSSFVEENGSELEEAVTVAVKGSLEALLNGSVLPAVLLETNGSFFEVEKGSFTGVVFENISAPVVVEPDENGSLSTVDEAGPVKGSLVFEEVKGSLELKGSLVKRLLFEELLECLDILSVSSAAVEEAEGANKLFDKNGSLMFD